MSIFKKTIAFAFALILAAFGWKLIVENPQVEKPFYAASSEVLEKCHTLADQKQILPEALGGGSQDAVFHKCVIDSNDPQFLKAAKKSVDQMRQDADR